MEELQQLLQGVLSDPAQMAQIASLAQSLGLDQPPAAVSEQTQTREQQTAAPGLDPGALKQLSALMNAMQGPEHPVFSALRPTLSQQGRKKLDRAGRAAKLSRLLSRYIRGKGGDANV